MMPALYKTNSQLAIVLAHWNNMSLLSGTLSWFGTIKLLLLKVACLTEKQQIPSLCYLVWSGVDLTIDGTRGEYANHYTTDAFFFLSIKWHMKIRQPVLHHKNDHTLHSWHSRNSHEAKSQHTVSVYLNLKNHLKLIYSQTCIKKSPLGQRKLTL